MKILFAIAVVVLVIFTSQGDALKCFVCNGCKTLADNEPHKDCPEEESTKLPPYSDFDLSAEESNRADDYRCIYLTQIKGNDKYLNRGCVLWKDSDEKTCTGFEKDHEDCVICKTDDCNSASAVVLPIIMIALSVIYHLI